MRTRLLPFLAAAAVLASTAACKSGASGSSAALNTDDDKTAYAFGFMAGSQAKNYKLSPEQIAAAKEGWADSANGKDPAIDMSVYAPKMNAMLREKMMAAQKAMAAEAAKRKEADKPFLEAAGKEKGAETLPSGVVYLSEKDGTGEMAKATDYVQVNYKGSLSDGTVFDASEKHGGPAKFFLNRVVPCWTQGVVKMKVGGKAKLTCPADTAYGDRGQGQIPGGAVLQFEVELLSIEPPPQMNAKAMLPIHPMPGHPASAPAPKK